MLMLVMLTNPSLCMLYTGIESIDIPRVLSQQGGEAVYPLPKIKALEVHPKLNLAALLFAVKHNHLYWSNSNCYI